MEATTEVMKAAMYDYIDVSSIKQIRATVVTETKLVIRKQVKHYSIFQLRQYCFSEEHVNCEMAHSQVY